MANHFRVCLLPLSFSDTFTDTAYTFMPMRSRDKKMVVATCMLTSQGQRGIAFLKHPMDNTKHDIIYIYIYIYIYTQLFKNTMENKCIPHYGYM